MNTHEVTAAEIKICKCLHLGAILPDNDRDLNMQIIEQNSELWVYIASARGSQQVETHPKSTSFCFQCTSP